jgi:small subunit ribosomal protein S3
LSTFRADIDYHIGEALTQYGKLGVKVWIMKGEVYGKRDLMPLVGQQKKGGPSGDRRDNRGGGDRRDNRGPRKNNNNNNNN